MSTSKEKIIEVFSQYRDKGLLRKLRNLNYESKINLKELYPEDYKNTGIREEDVENVLEKFLNTLREEYSEEDITSALNFLAANIDTFKS